MLLKVDSIRMVVVVDIYTYAINKYAILCAWFVCSGFCLFQNGKYRLKAQVYYRIYFTLSFYSQWFWALVARFQLDVGKLSENSTLKHSYRYRHKLEMKLGIDMSEMEKARQNTELCKSRINLLLQNRIERIGFVMFFPSLFRIYRKVH